MNTLASVQSPAAPLVFLQAKTGKPTYDALLKPLVGKPITREALRSFFESATHSDGVPYAPASLVVIRAAVKKYLLDLAPVHLKGSALWKFQVEDLMADVKVPRPDASIDAHQVLKEVDVNRILAAETEPRRLALFNFLRWTGVRVSEAMAIRLSDCKRRGDGYVYLEVQRGKGNKSRSVFLPELSFDTIRDAFHGTTFLFEVRTGRPMHRRHAHRLLAEMGKKHLKGKTLHPHKLRHTFATEAIEKKGLDLGKVSRYLGHASPTTTAAIYVHTKATPEDLFPEPVTP